MTLKARLVHPCVFDDVHVVEPDVLHTAFKILPCHQGLAWLQEVINATQMYLFTMKDCVISFTVVLHNILMGLFVWAGIHEGS